MRNRTDSNAIPVAVTYEDPKKASEIISADGTADYEVASEKAAASSSSDCYCSRCCHTSILCSCTVPCCGTRSTLKCTRIQLAVGLLVTVVVLVFGVFSFLPAPYIHREIIPLTTAKPSAIANSHTRILLYGDSQWGIIERAHHITTQIAEYVPAYPLQFTVVGDLGVRAYNLNERIHRYLHLRPNVVFINLDSDVSNVNENILNAHEKLKVRDLYRANISSVVERWQQTGALVALGGPGLLGEGPIHPLHIQRFDNKDVMLDAYVQINKEVAIKYGIPYFDVRAKLKKALPWYRLYYNGYVTKDGEHPNGRGTTIEAKMVAKVLLGWMESRSFWPNITTPITTSNHKVVT